MWGEVCGQAQRYVKECAQVCSEEGGDVWRCRSWKDKGYVLGEHKRETKHDRGESCMHRRVVTKS